MRRQFGNIAIWNNCFSSPYDYKSIHNTLVALKLFINSWSNPSSSTPKSTGLPLPFVSSDVSAIGWPVEHLLDCTASKSLQVYLGTVNLLKLFPVKCLATQVGPFSAAYFPIFTLCSGEYELYFPRCCDLVEAAKSKALLIDFFAASISFRGWLYNAPFGCCSH